MLCPCGKSISYQACCGQYIDENMLPSDPEALMRSRYTAFVLGKITYLRDTMQGKAAKKFNFAGLEEWLKKVTWDGLIVIKTKSDSKIHGYVTFEARYHEDEKQHVIREKSEFKKIAGKWFYVYGK